jgi:hypothetical protein
MSREACDLSRSAAVAGAHSDGVSSRLLIRYTSRELRAIDSNVDRQIEQQCR